MPLQNYIRFVMNLRRLESLQTDGKAPFLQIFKYKIKREVEEGGAKRTTE